MRAASVTVLALASACSFGQVAWCPTVRTAVVLAQKTHRPILVRVLSPMGPAFPVYPTLEDPKLQTRLRRFIFVRALYDDLQRSIRGLPASGSSGLMLLDSAGRVLKRFGGFVHDSDVLYVIERGEWRERQEKAIRALSPAALKQPGVQADIATLKVMSGELGAATQILSSSQAIPPAKRAVLFEAVADERRAQGDISGAISDYRNALAQTTATPSRTRILLHLSVCLLRNGDLRGAENTIAQVLKTEQNDQVTSYANMVRRSIQNENGPRIARPTR